jgi:hypothetical protein
VPPVTLTLIGKPGCHLCDDAREVIRSVVAELPADAVPVIEEKNILEDPVLHEQYVEDIPVVQLDGRNHTYWRVDPARLRAALLEAR